MANETPPKPAPAPYSPGLEGVIAGETSISSVDPNAGLMYRGYDIKDLAPQASFEEIVWLLLHGELPTSAQYEEMREILGAESKLPDAVVNMLLLMPKDANPNDTLRTGVSMLASFDKELNDHSHDANVRKAVRLVAKTSTLVTSGWRIQKGQNPFTPGANLTHAARFLFSLFGREPEQWETSAFNNILAQYAEHGYNASTFAARVTASTMSDIYAAVTSAIGTLKGPLHGGSNEEAMKMLRDVGTADRAGSWVKDRLARKEKIMGFGHRVYKKGDSRVPVMRELARQIGKRFNQPQWAEVCESLESAMEKQKGLYANVDLYAAPVFHMMGIPMELNTPIFACSRMAGWCAHVIEQHDKNRIIRPSCNYTGLGRRAYKSMR